MTGQPLAQIHAYDPGIAANGLFWTIQIPDNSVSVQLLGTSSLQLTSLAINDATTNKNSILGRPTVPASITSLTIIWKSFRDRDTTNGFEGVFTQSVATTEWSVTQAATSPSNPDGFQFVSDPGDTSTALFAVIGHERNGVFFD